MLRLRLLPLLFAVLPAFGARGQTLVARGATWAYFKGRTEPSTPSDAWRQPAFDDSAWSRGASGIGYGDGDDRTVLPDMQNNYASVYMRIRFDVADPATVAGLELLIDYDDGFVAYLNGTEVARRGLEGDPVPHNRLAWDHEAGERENVPLSDAHELLVPGSNVLAIQVHNSGLASSDLSCEPQLLVLPYDPAERGPWLQSAKQDSVVVRWRTRQATVSRVEYGDPVLLGQVAESLVPSNEHEIALTGLRPGTRYGYRVLAGSEVRSDIQTFWTLPRVGTSGFDIAVLGESGTGEVPEYAIGRRIREMRPELIIHAGDAVFPDGRDGNWNAQVFAPLEDAMGGAALHPAAGAIDLGDRAGATWRQNWTTFGNDPACDETSYSYDAGNVHVAVLDATQPLDAASAQVAWLTDDLTASTACWKLVVLDSPLVTGTARFDDPAIAAQRAVLAPLFEQKGVDVVLTSGVGAFERSFPWLASGPTQQSQEPSYSDPAPIYVVTGGGGRPLERVSTGPRIAAAQSQYHFVRLDFQGSTLTITARSETATDLDVATITKTCAADTDGDTIPDASDNCPYVANPTQVNVDLDAYGDACEPDTDGDGVIDDADDCPFAHDPAQADLDADGLGDACDFDDDGDGVNDSADDCPVNADPAQADVDRDGIGDACDPDADGDSIPNAGDNCPLVSNVNQTDVDGDGLGNACDDDDDGDGVNDVVDNCQYVVNPTQVDVDGDGQGDHCDADDDGDGIDDVLDDCPKVADPSQADLDGDGLGDACESDQDGDRVPITEDCDDRNPDVGGVPEGIATLRARRAGGNVQLSWEPPVFAQTQSQVASGRIADLWADRGPARTTCEATGGASSATVTLTADDRWYLARRSNACARGPWGSATLDAASPCP